jgi:hypothetical protein
MRLLEECESMLCLHSNELCHQNVCILAAIPVASRLWPGLGEKQFEGRPPSEYAPRRVTQQAAIAQDEARRRCMQLRKGGTISRSPRSCIFAASLRCCLILMEGVTLHSK